MKKLQKVVATVIAAVIFMVNMTGVAYGATELMKDGEFTGAGFVNAGEVKDGVITGPGNWTQLNMGDAAVDGKYLHLVMMATGDTAAAEITVSDTANFKLADLGVTLTEEYQDVALPLEGKDLSIISWVNLAGLDGGSSVYQVKEVFLSDEPAQAAEVPAQAAEETPAADAPAEDIPKTGDNMMSVTIAVIVLAGAAVLLFMNKKAEHKMGA